MSVTYGIVWRIRAISGLTLWPGSCPPSPGLAPCAILICSSSAFTRNSVVAPKRPEATCRIRDRVLSPFGSGMFRSGSSPPSPELLRPPIRFIAMAIVSWVSLLMEPNDIAAVTKRGRIFSTGSTSSRGTGVPLRKRNSERSVACASDWSLMSAAYSL